MRQPVKGISGSTQPTKSVATRIWSTCTSSDTASVYTTFVSYYYLYYTIRGGISAADKPWLSTSLLKVSVPHNKNSFEGIDWIGLDGVRQQNFKGVSNQDPEEKAFDR